MSKEEVSVVRQFHYHSPEMNTTAIRTMVVFESSMVMMMVSRISFWYLWIQLLLLLLLLLVDAAVVIVIVVVVLPHPVLVRIDSLFG
jgi:hypothetical protein